MSTEKKKILVVEDEPDVAELLKERLELKGYEVHVESLGREAVEHARVERPDLVVLDVMLPDVDGFTVGEELRKHYGSWTLPILMLTAKAQASDKLKGYGAGGDAYLTKPYDARELLRTVAFMIHACPT
jgi:two-component system OmpR family response regulator